MEEKRPSIIEQIPPDDWEKTPASVKKMVELMAQRIDSLEQQAQELLSAQEQLLEKVNKTSKNSSLPPSSDPPGKSQKSGKKSGKKRGGQPGHEGRGRNLYPVEKCSSVIDHHPVTCSCCGESLKGEDTLPYRHQILEIPPIEPIVIEHRLHQLTCSRCGTATRAKLPDNISSSG
jgi:transposase